LGGGLNRVEEIMPATEASKDVHDLLSAAGKDVYRGCEAKDWTPYTLDEPRLTFWAVEQAQGITDNGGFQYFFESDWPEKPNYIIFVNAYRRIGAKESADWIEDAVEQFPFADPQLDYKSRREYLVSSRSAEGEYDSVIDRLGDRVIDLSGDTYTLLASYVRDNIDAFPAAKEFLSKR
jgi:hypothetical protein